MKTIGMSQLVIDTRFEEVTVWINLETDAVTTSRRPLLGFCTKTDADRETSIVPVVFADDGNIEEAAWNDADNAASEIVLKGEQPKQNLEGVVRMKLDGRDWGGKS